MAQLSNITIPRTAIVSDSKPYTVYEISLQLPLQSLVLRKRYSDFVKLDHTLNLQTGSAPPAALPPKHYFSRTTNNEALTESRRADLEHYLKTINKTVDTKWREAPVWRAFLNLPSNFSSTSSKAASLRTVTDGNSEDSLSDPVLWLEGHGQLKGILHEARLNIAARDRTEDVASSHGSAAEVKRALQQASALIARLEKGLKVRQEGWEKERIGEGESRRRRDLVVDAKKEKEDLEKLVVMIAKKREIDDSIDIKRTLVQEGEGTATSNNPDGPGLRRGRILGRETAKTRELDNKDVLHLQQQMMQEQDEDIEALAATIRRQKELAVQINEELELQTEMIDLVNEDATRLEGKVGVAKKRLSKIS